MTKKPLGFVSKSGIITAGVVIALAGLWTGLFGPVLFSPGALSEQATGRTLGGMKNHAATKGGCDICHAEPWSTQDMASRCVRCHSNLNAEIKSKKGVHGLLVTKSSTITCRGCHTEHKGPDAALTIVDEGTFPHELTGFSLKGHEHTVKGPAFTCRDCHVKDVLHFDQATCDRCHTSIDAKFMSAHKATFGAECLICHNGSGEDGANFDHNKFAFKLTGAHANAPCVACHSRAGSPRALSDTPTDCYSCHAGNDRHRGALGKRCDQCHTTISWRGASFSHSSLGGNLATKDCYSCHSGDDRHGGALGRQCGQCHSTTSWGRATFNHGGFPIGHGAAATCVTCHPKGTGTYTCFGCHEHTVPGILAEHGKTSLASIKECVACHRGGSSFSHGGFPSNHGGAGSCGTCHPKGTSTYTCFGCHEHTSSNIAGEHDGRPLSAIRNCVACHRGGGGEGGEGGHEGRRGGGDDD